jgi:hypothetical protein
MIAPVSALRGVAQQGIDPVVADQAGQGAASHVAAANDQ